MKLRTTLALALCMSAAQAGDVLKRFPHASAERIVFVAQGRLWQVARSGGVASQLAPGATRPVMPRYSPDGQWIAFSAQRDGHQDVYVMPAAGGEPRRLTFNPNYAQQKDDMVVTWTPDSRHIVFGSRMQAWNQKGYRMFLVPREGGLPQPLPMEHAGLMSYAADARHIAYTQVLNDFDARKRYDGGLAQDIYTYDLDTHASQKITHWKGNDTAPMWYGRSIYYLSDSDSKRRMNLWAYDQDSGKSRQLTFFTDFDIDFPALGGQQITFQQGGKLYALDLPTERLHEIRVTLPADTSPPVQEVDAARFIREGDAEFALAPDGGAAVFSARGDLFAVATGANAVTRLTATSGADEERPAFSPDGKLLAYITDVNGEQQVAVRPAQGGAERLLTHSTRGAYYTPVWSPDGKTLAVADSDKRLWLLTVADGTLRDVAHDLHRVIDDAAFSPDGRWLAYSIQAENQQRGIHLYDIAAGRDHVVSSPMNSDWKPAFSEDGQYLYFLSARHELPVSSSSEEAFATVNPHGIYVTTLRQQAPSAVRALRASAPAGGAAAANGQIDVEGLMRRAVPVPVGPGNYSGLAVRQGNLVYLSQPMPLVAGELPGQQNALHLYDMQRGEDRVLQQDVEQFRVSGDGRRVLIKQGDQWKTIATAAGAADSQALSFKGMTATINRKEEWAALYNKVWRLDRDFYLSPTMNGIDWPAVRKAYARLLPLLGSRDDLNYLIGQLQGELATSHMVYGSGDFGPPPNRPATPRLGADYALDAASGRYRLARIYPGDNSRPSLRSPLAEPGLDVREGDYLLAINGKPLAAPHTPDELLEGLNGKLELLVADKPDGTPRQVTVDPVRNEMALREEYMIEQNRRKVEQLSGGRVAYVFVRDFHQTGAEQFVRQFYPQMDKQALIFDVRWNLGGFTSQQILARLRRNVAGLYVNRAGGRETLPAQQIIGPKVALTNQFTGSDGDQFAYYFRDYGIGKVVGQRSWGGVRGVTGAMELADGGYLAIPKDALYSPDSRWLIENHGTDPDAEVNDVPGETLAGKDAQLEAAIRMLVDALDRQPTVLPPAPPALPSYPKEGDVPGPSL
ncbi:peptidase S41 family protein [Janthinobacterium sp. HH01]|uniref:S41 family peptidase n=1 Tax=Janthinobacterium sp. HH01 TaxID=1198452 RepID=UPI0002AEA4CA|nr:S41 family peptidase [Janthinobacterium sp. HH01]ELX11639.1 peptidase S41 family protein [Janthinobacterium sp. HH01]